MKILKLFLTFLIADPLSAAKITWDAPQNISGPADFKTEGYYYWAWSPELTEAFLRSQIPASLPSSTPAARI